MATPFSPTFCLDVMLPVTIFTFQSGASLEYHVWVFSRGGESLSPAPLGVEHEITTFGYRTPTKVPMTGSHEGVSIDREITPAKLASEMST